MSLAPACPRCAGSVRAPDLMSSAWRCDEHGEVHPCYVAPRPGGDLLEVAARKAEVPVWAPLPLLPGWALSGLATAGDERTGHRAVAVALTGPSPLGGPADLLLVAEEPGTGLGARLAGVPGVDVMPLLETAPDAKVEAAGHPTALWRVPAEEGAATDRVALVGEAGGVWLWAVLWPPAAELVLLEHVVLRDLRHHAVPDGLPVAAPCGRLAG